MELTPQAEWQRGDPYSYASVTEEEDADFRARGRALAMVFTEPELETVGGALLVQIDQHFARQRPTALDVYNRDALTAMYVIDEALLLKRE